MKLQVIHYRELKELAKLKELERNQEDKVSRIITHTERERIREREEDMILKSKEKLLKRKQNEEN